MNQKDFEDKVQQVADFTYTSGDKSSIKIKKIKHEVKQCEDCDNLVEDRLVEIEFRKSGFCKKYCDNCSKYADYETGEFRINEGKEWQQYYCKVELPIVKKLHPK